MRDGFDLKIFFVANPFGVDRTEAIRPLAGRVAASIAMFVNSGDLIRCPSRSDVTWPRMVCVGLGSCPRVPGGDAL